MSPNNKIVIPELHLIVNVSTARGGVTVVRELIDHESLGDGAREETKVIKRVDHAAVVKQMDALVKSTDAVCRRHATKTAFGWAANDYALAAIDREMAPLIHQAGVLNDWAEREGSDRRCTAGFVVADLRPETAAPAIWAALADAMEEMHNLFVVPTDLEGFRADAARLLRKHNGLSQLVTGPMLVILDDAQRAFRVAVEAAREMLRQGGTVEDAVAGADLHAMAAASTWFGRALANVPTPAQGRVSTTTTTVDSDDDGAF